MAQITLNKLGLLTELASSERKAQNRVIALFTNQAGSRSLCLTLSRRAEEAKEHRHIKTAYLRADIRARGSS